MRNLLTTIAFLLPFRNLKIRLLNRLGHDIHPGAHIGVNLVRNVERFELAEGAIIGSFNIFGRIKRVSLERDASIAYFNLVMVGVSGDDVEPTDDAALEELRGSLIMGERARIISFHMLDCSGGLIIRKNGWLTGFRSTLLSHAFDPTGDGLIIEPIEIEEGAIVGTSCTLLPGSVVGTGDVLAAGSTLWTRQKLASECLHGGVPARRLGPIKISDWVYEA
ncbi:hypothetical protein GCM10028801_11430 [Nocardioides maradonensis]